LVALVLEDQGERFLGEVAPADEPLVVLLDQHRADEADCRGVVGEDADDVRSAPNLLVEPLERVGAAELWPVRGREAVEGQEVFFGCLEQLCDLRQRVTEALQDLADLHPAAVLTLS